MASEETLRTVEESRAARLTENLGHYRTLSHRTRALLRRDKVRYVRALAEDVEVCFNASNLRAAYRVLKKLPSKYTLQTSNIRTADGRIVSDMDEVRSRWVEYFEQFYVAEPPIRQLSIAGVQLLAAYPSVDETPPTLAEAREAVNKLKCGKGAGICNVSAKMLKAEGEASIRGLPAVISGVWQSGTIPPD